MKDPKGRRAFLKLLPLLGGVPLFLRQSLARQPMPRRPLIGAIRWDAWYDPADGTVAKAVEKALGPSPFHYRMPFFGQVTGPDSVRIDGDAQPVMDREIAAAAAAGIDYWAFCVYPANDPMSNALNLYLASRRRSEIKFCIFNSMCSSIDYFKTATERDIGLMLEPGYAKVLGDRPLYYILPAADDQIQKDGGIGKIAEWVRYVRAQVQSKGGGNPYFVLSEANPQRAQNICRSLGLDAVGLYATALGPFGGAPYAELVRQTENYWNVLAATGLQVVPNIMTGWDTRPRDRAPPPWENRPPQPNPMHYYQEAQPQEIANHVRDALQWLAAHPQAADTALIYAWNECDEGFGSLIPTYNPNDKNGNDARLKALAGVLS